MSRPSLKAMREADFVKLAKADPYWKGRWPYLKQAIAYVRKIEARTALEIGPNNRPLFEGSHTMDVIGKPTFLYDVSITPWPIADQSYDAVIGLQVWEHLMLRQRQAFRQAMRVAKSAVLSFPLEWDCPRDEVHHGITRSQIYWWANDIKPDEETLIGEGTKKPRLVCLWRFWK